MGFSQMAYIADFNNSTEFISAPPFTATVMVSIMMIITTMKMLACLYEKPGRLIADYEKQEKEKQPSLSAFFL